MDAPPVCVNLLFDGRGHLLLEKHEVRTHVQVSAKSGTFFRMTMSQTQVHGMNVIAYSSGTFLTHSLPPLLLLTTSYILCILYMYWERNHKCHLSHFHVEYIIMYTDQSLQLKYSYQD